MRILLVLTVALVLAMPVAAEQLDFTFLGATDHTYRTTTFVEDLSINGWPPEELVSIKVLLIETPSLAMLITRSRTKLSILWSTTMT